MPRRPGRHSRRAGAHTALTAMTFGKQGIQARIRPVSSAILDFVENRLHNFLSAAPFRDPQKTGTQFVFFGA